MEIYTLYSGSSGNALLARCGGTVILIDAGRSRRALSRAMAAAGASLSEAAAIFVTHEHVDHIAALAQIARHEGIPIYAAAGSADFLTGDAETAGCLVRQPVLFSVTVGEITVSSVPLPHDSACHVGYRLSGSDGDSFLCATDMGCVTDAVRQALCGCRGALLEANYDADMLRTGPYPAALKSRIQSARGHLSNEDCAALCEYAVSVGVSQLALGHLSKENNTPEKACAAVRARIGEAAQVTVCHRTDPTRIL